MKKLLLISALVFASNSFAAENVKLKSAKGRIPSSNKNLKCSANELKKGGEKVAFTLASQGMGNQIGGEAKLNNHTFIATWNQGDEFESQATFTMVIGDYSSTLYDFTAEGHVGPINLITTKDIRFQCWFE